MKLISFNVNGIRSMTGKLKNGEKKGSMSNNCLTALVAAEQPDILCLQEIKTQNETNRIHNGIEMNKQNGSEMGIQNGTDMGIQNGTDMGIHN